MTKSTEMLKELCNERGIEWKTQYAGALGKYGLYFPAPTGCNRAGNGRNGPERG